MRLALLVPVGFAAGAIACRLLLVHAPRAFGVDLAQPLVVVTYWGNFGALMFLALFAAIAIASIGYIACLTPPRLASKPEAPFDSLRSLRTPAGHSTTLMMTTRPTMTYCALACAAALFFPVVFSSDVYAYAGYGLMALHGLNPYAHAAIAVRDPLIDAVLWQWGNPPPACVYGPAFVSFARTIVAIFVGFGPAAPLWALRVGACAALVLCAPLAFAAFPASTRAAAALGIALNPVAIWSAAEGHNDTLLIAIVLAGFALLARGRPFVGAAVVALSGLVKAPGLLAAAAAPLMYASSSSRSRVWLGTALGLAATAAVAWPAFEQLSRDTGHGGYFPQFSLQYALNLFLGTPVTLAVTSAGAAVCAAAGVIMLRKKELQGAPLLALALWIAIPNPYPWYALWILPIAFVAWETPAAWTIVALTLCVAARYFPDATTDVPRAFSLAIVCSEFAIPLILWVVLQRGGRWKRMQRNPSAL